MQSNSHLGVAPHHNENHGHLDAHNPAKHTIKVFNNHNSQHKIELVSSFSITKKHDIEIFGCAFDVKDENIAIACGDGTIRIFDQKKEHSHDPITIKTHQYTSLMSIDPPLTCLKWRKRKDPLASVDTYQVGVGNEVIADDPKAPNNILCVSADGCMKEVSLQSHKQVFERTDDQANQLYALDIDNKGYHFATAGLDTQIRVYDEHTKKLVAKMHSTQSISGHSNRVQCLKFSPYKEEMLFSGGWDNDVFMYDLRQKEPVLGFNGPQINGEAIDIHHGGLLLTGSYTPNNCLQLWDLRKHTEPARTIDWDGGDKDSSGNWINNFEEYSQNSTSLGEANAFLYAAKFNIEGNLIFACGGSGKNELRVFNFADGQLVGCMHNFEAPLFSLDVSKQQGTNKAAFGSADSFLRVIHVAQNKTQ
ncbi:wd repeat protein [Stylonychia lemnae]|uniref:Wd repeat protein n=1 Tax=Stylonychia lemnae TaxID=5949 RepID=A0A078AR03_STYLE|nr:wd repeat protein [Stylonychia lemnae]|eukprot:CDW83313.1 wd repeat protein [Stylonychia lemnae]